MRRGIVLTSLTCLALFAGCVTTSTEKKVSPPTYTPVPSGTKATVEHAVASDPCAARMHEVAGTILMYYALNKQLPQTLADLQPLADQPLDFTCAASGLPYVYAPRGLSAPGQPKLMVLHDSTASHDKQRYCVFMAPAGPAAAQSMEVLAVPEVFFRTYTPAD